MREENLADQPPEKRVKVGRKFENGIANVLNSSGRLNEGVDRRTDAVLKIDLMFKKSALPEPVRSWFTEHKDEKIPAQVKFRFSGIDTLNDMEEPFFGIKDPRNKIGRDRQSAYQLYLFSSKDVDNTIIAIRGSSMKKATAALYEEFQASGVNLSPTSKIFRSAQFPGCEIRYMVDRHSGVPKILAFVPPSFFKTKTHVDHIKHLNLKIVPTASVVESIIWRE